MDAMTDVMPEVAEETEGEESEIRPFQVSFPDEDLTDLRRRIKATRWPERETVPDASQGVQLAMMQELARYWATEYDWRKVETRLNALPNFITEIDGLDIHFIHVRSKHENALPVIVTHGWPGSIIEQLKIVDPLVNPTAHGGKASDAFDVVIPSMPGYGFSGKPTTTGWDQARIARAWAVLMKRLGYTRYVAQGGDWGAIINDLFATQGHPELIGFHTNLPNAIPPEINKAAAAGSPAPTVSRLKRSARTRRLFCCTRRFRHSYSWRRTRKRCTASRIHPSAWQPGCSTTTRSVCGSSHVLSTGSRQDLPGMMCSTTPHCSG
jgi:pimeloyl-ACP methyl ester carboxylesterase